MFLNCIHILFCPSKHKLVMSEFQSNAPLCTVPVEWGQATGRRPTDDTYMSVMHMTSKE
jgi:hypothetical protein